MVAMGKSMEGGSGRKVGDGILPEGERWESGRNRKVGWRENGRGEETGWGDGAVAARIA